jgi:RNA-directed DNA polymerase
MPAGTDETFVVLHLLSRGASRRTTNYYGRFYPSALRLSFRHLNDTLIRWAMRKYKRLRRHRSRARRLIADVARRQPNLFAHWRFGARPDDWTTGAR